MMEQYLCRCGDNIQYDVANSREYDLECPSCKRKIHLSDESALWKWLLLSASEQLNEGDFRAAIVDAQTAMETFMAKTLNLIFFVKEFPHDELSFFWKNIKPGFNELKMVLIKIISDRGGDHSKEIVDSLNKLKIAELRNRVVHSDGYIPSKQEVEAAKEAVEDSIYEVIGFFDFGVLAGTKGSIDLLANDRSRKASLANSIKLAEANKWLQKLNKSIVEQRSGRNRKLQKLISERYSWNWMLLGKRLIICFVDCVGCWKKNSKF